MARAALSAAWGLVTLLLAAGLIEGGVRVFDIVPHLRDATRSPAVSDELEQAESERLDRQLHPFLGWSRTPGPLPPKPLADVFGDEPPSDWARANATVNSLGFQSALDDYRSVGADEFVVGVFGGSVASQLASYAGDALARAIAEVHPALAGKVRILNFASGGYKQPQQVIALLESIALGIPLDVVVNIDGFNEVHLGGRDARNGRHPFFPSRNHYAATLALFAEQPDRSHLLLAAEAISRRDAADALRRNVDTGPGGKSELVRALAGARIRRHERDAVAAENELAQDAAAATGGSLAAEFSDDCNDEGRDCDATAIRIWADSSRTMAAIADRFDARYLHFLQPNQYVPGSKELTEEELRVAWRDTRALQRVGKTYPRLRIAGAELAAEGIAFQDLSLLFQRDERTLYRDDCCHYNATGNVLVARAIGAAVAERLGPAEALR